MESSDDDNDSFQSADEFVDADSDCNIATSPISPQQTNNKDTLKTADDICSPIKISFETRERRDGEVFDNSFESDTNENAAPANYRKRPERPKRPGRTNADKAKNTELKEVLGKVARSDTLIKDFKTQLTSNITKGLTKFQETSSSLKGLVLGPVDREKDGERFVYDDCSRLEVSKVSECSPGTAVQSALSEEILKLSNAFARLNAEKSENLLNTPEDTTVLLDQSLSDVILAEKSQFSGKPLNIDSKKVVPVSQPAPEIGRLEEIESQTLPNKKSKEDSQSIVISNEGEGDGSSSVLDDLNHTEDVAFKPVSALTDGWDSWTDNVDENEKLGNEDSNLVSEECLATIGSVYDDVNDNRGLKKEDELVKGSATNSEAAAAVPNEINTSQWDEDKIDDSEKGNAGPEEEIPEGNGLIEDICDDDGWGDWGDDEVGNTPNVSNKLDNKDSDCVLDDGNGWGDFEEYPIEEKDRKDDSDGWEDWGDDEDEPPSILSPSKTSNSATVPLRTLPQDSLTDQEWKGWDTFGQKKADREWGIGGWGLGTLLNTATVVSSNLSAVTQGISTVIESGLGVPDPETMARMQLSEEKTRKEKDGHEGEIEPESSAPFPFRSIVSGVGKIVEVAKVQEIGSRVLSGGLDTLETIGKKTMEVLQEGDPGLKKKRALLLGNGQALSQVLREARDKSVVEDKKTGELAASRRCHFETVFDDFQGLIHLEALEMLSTQCQLRIQQLLEPLPPNKLKELQDTLEEVKELCELDEDFDLADSYNFKEALIETVEPVKNEISVAKIVEVHDKLLIWLRSVNANSQGPGAIYDKAITAIAELTASATQQFHKGGELLLLKERRKTVEEADCLLQLSGHISTEIQSLSERVAELLRATEDPASDLLVSNFRVESENATAYIKQALGLLLPVIQLGAI